MKFIMARVSEKSVPTGAGVYLIFFRRSGPVYVGSTFNFQDRFGKHLSKLIRKKHPNKKLQRLFNRKHILFFQPVASCALIELTRIEQEVLDRYSHRAINVTTTVRYYRRKRK